MLEREKHIDISLEPLDEYLVIQPSNDETETRAGLILPASAAASVAASPVNFNSSLHSEKNDPVVRLSVTSPMLTFTV